MVLRETMVPEIPSGRNVRDLMMRMHMSYVKQYECVHMTNDSTWISNCVLHVQVLYCGLKLLSYSSTL